MKLLCRVIALLLLMAMVSPVGLAHGPAQAAAAGCHEHSQKAPEPVSYQCCRAGHQFAAVREAVNLRAAFVLVSCVVEFAVNSSSEFVYQASLKPLALGSPGVTALRI